MLVMRTPIRTVRTHVKYLRGGPQRPDPDDSHHAMPCRAAQLARYLMSMTDGDYGLQRANSDGGSDGGGSGSLSTASALGTRRGSYDTLSREHSMGQEELNLLLMNEERPQHSDFHNNVIRACWFEGGVFPEVDSPPPLSTFGLIGLFARPKDREFLCAVQVQTPCYTCDAFVIHFRMYTVFVSKKGFKSADA